MIIGMTATLHSAETYLAQFGRHSYSCPCNVKVDSMGWRSSLGQHGCVRNSVNLFDLDTTESTATGQYTTRTRLRSIVWQAWFEPHRDFVSGATYAAPCNRQDSPCNRNDCQRTQALQCIATVSPMAHSSKGTVCVCVCMCVGVMQLVSLGCKKSNWDAISSSGMHGVPKLD